MPLSAQSAVSPRRGELKGRRLEYMTEQEAIKICKEKIAEHGLEMKLVNCEFNSEENKTTFFFTADGRVDFRELVKDLAAVFHNRIELRQIGVRDEAKMLGGIGICGRPYCCKEFLDDFAPVSTKMAKVQNLSLNPTKISGSCGRLLCCLRYEEEAYEELTPSVPKQGAFVETPDGYGVAVTVNLLRQQVRVALDNDGDGSTRLYKAKQVASVPGGRPKDGVKPPHVLNYDPALDKDEEEPEDEDPWATPVLFAESSTEEAAPEAEASSETSEAETPSKNSNSKKRHRRYFRNKKGGSKNKGNENKGAKK